MRLSDHPPVILDPRISGVEPTETTAQPLVVPGTHPMVQHCDKVTTENALTTAVSLHCFPERLAHKACFDWWARVPRQPEETLGPLGRRSVEISLWQSVVQRRATTQSTYV